MTAGSSSSHHRIAVLVTSTPASGAMLHMVSGSGKPSSLGYRSMNRLFHRPRATRNFRPAIANWRQARTLIQSVTYSTNERLVMKMIDDMVPTLRPADIHAILAHPPANGQVPA